MQFLEISGLTVEYRTKFPSEMERLFGGYSVCRPDDSRPRLEVDPEPWVDVIRDRTGLGAVSAEFYALSVALGEMLPLYGRLRTHGAAIGYDGRAYIFAAPSGTGKSTRASLWQQYLGKDQVSIINGDKPILWFKDTEVMACGSPWAGKERLQKNVCVPIGGICLLHRSPENVIRTAGPKEFFDFYSREVQMPGEPQAMFSTLSLLEELYSKVPTFVLENDMSEQGVKIAFEALTGKQYERCRI